MALWREGLLARAVQHGQTRGYLNHPQLDRFKAHSQPKPAIDAYLAVAQDEATARRCDFERNKPGRIHRVEAIAVEHGQLEHPRTHPLAKRAACNPPARTLAQWRARRASAIRNERGLHRGAGARGGDWPGSETAERLKQDVSALGG